MKKLFLILFVGMFLISLASADGTLGTFKLNDCISLYQYCDTCTYVNLTTVQFPNGTIQTINNAMTKTDVDYNYTYCDTSTIGTYYYTVKGDKGGIVNTERISFEVTPSGFTGTLGFYILILVLSLGVVVLGYFAQDATVIIFGSFGLIFIGLYFLFNGINGIKDSVYTWGISIIILGLAFYLLVKASQEFLN